MSLPGETEACSAGTQPCRGISWWSYRCLENPRPEGGILTDGERPLSIFRLNQYNPSGRTYSAMRKSRHCLERYCEGRVSPIENAIHTILRSSYDLLDLACWTTHEKSIVDRGENLNATLGRVDTGPPQDFGARGLHGKVQLKG
jgi:hypothetical protein